MEREGPRQGEGERERERENKKIRKKGISRLVSSEIHGAACVGTVLRAAIASKDTSVLKRRRR